MRITIEGADDAHINDAFVCFYDVVVLLACDQHSVIVFGEKKEDIRRSAALRERPDPKWLPMGIGGRVGTRLSGWSQPLSSCLMHFYVALYLIMDHIGASHNRLCLPHRYKQLNN